MYYKYYAKTLIVNSRKQKPRPIGRGSDHFLRVARIKIQPIKANTNAIKAKTTQTCVQPIARNIRKYNYLKLKGDKDEIIAPISFTNSPALLSKTLAFCSSRTARAVVKRASALAAFASSSRLVTFATNSSI